MDNIKAFIEAAKKGIVTVEFDKINGGGLRIMPCTLNAELSNHNVPEILEQRDDNEHFVVWALDKEAWRSFRANTVVRWYEGHPPIGHWRSPPNVTTNFFTSD